MSIETKTIRTSNLDPWLNLSFEECLFEQVKEGQCWLYLWQNQNTVVIGKNQNPWRECRTKLLEEEEGKLARRLSGGGAVFHDMGNLNFTFVVDRQLYDFQRQLEVILSAVRKVGIQAEFTGRNDISVEGRKFSGNAFCFRTKSAFHHGTLLVSANLSKLTRYLQVSPEKMQSKGVKSVESRVTNLQEYNPGVTIDEMAKAFQQAFHENYGGDLQEQSIEEAIDMEKAQKLYEKYSSWEWRYGESPEFDLELEHRFTWGGVEFGLKLEQGRVNNVVVYSDSLDESFIDSLPGYLQGCVFDSHLLAKRLLDLPLVGERKNMADDIAQWLQSKTF